MPSHASTAAASRRRKEARPELYCAHPGCLWRTGGPRGTPCQKHPTVGAWEGVEVMEAEWREEARRFREGADIPTLTPITARPVDLNPEAWGEDASGEDDKRPDLPALNRLTKALADLDESLMNVGWDGEPRDVCVAQLAKDARVASDILRVERDALAERIGATWDTERERYVLAELDDAPRCCYVKGCGETENLEPCFVGEYVCPECKASQQHQRDVAGELALEGAEG